MTRTRPVAGGSDELRPSDDVTIGPRGDRATEKNEALGGLEIRNHQIARQNIWLGNEAVQLARRVGGFGGSGRDFRAERVGGNRHLQRFADDSGSTGIVVRRKRWRRRLGRRTVG